MQSTLFSVALQKKAHSRLVSLQVHLWIFAVHSGVEGPKKKTMQLLCRLQLTLQCARHLLGLLCCCFAQLQLFA